MIDPVEASDIMRAVIAGALVIMFGACYALFFALSRLKDNKPMLLAAYGGYLGLAVSVYVLSQALHLNGYWQTVVWAMLLGYLLAPQWIWRLCVGTHEAADIQTDFISPPERSDAHG